MLEYIFLAYLSNIGLATNLIFSISRLYFSCGLFLRYVMLFVFRLCISFGAPSFPLSVIKLPITFISMFCFQIERPLQRHGGRLEHDEVYCGSCYGAEVVCFLPHILENTWLFAIINLYLILWVSHTIDMHVKISRSLSFAMLTKCGIWCLHTKWQSDNDCCNSCEEVREAYRKKGWGLNNQELIDQVSWRFIFDLATSLKLNLKHFSKSVFFLYGFIIKSLCQSYHKYANFT